jgi:hypothetical protein
MSSPRANSHLTLENLQEIKICTYNIRNGNNGCINFALRAMSEMNITMGFLTETKIVANNYPTEVHGYKVIATEAKSHHQGGVAFFYQSTTPGFTLEGTRTFGPNVIRTTLVSGKRRWTMLGAYIPPSELDNSTINYIQLATQYEPNHELILLGDLNVNINNMTRSNPRHDDTVALIASLGLIDPRQHFRLKNNTKWTWHQYRTNRYVTSECDYILTTNIKDIRNIKIKTPTSYDSDHRLVLVSMHLNVTEHKKYMRRKTKLPKEALVNNDNPADRIFGDINKAQDKTIKTQENTMDWISEETYNLFRWKTMARKKGQTRNAQRLSRLLKKHLQYDCQQRMTKVAINATTTFEQHDSRMAYHHLKDWYKTRQNKPSNPTNNEMETIRSEFIELFTNQQPSSAPIQTYVEYDIPDGAPQEDEVVTALYKMQLRKSPGASGISVEQL